jgi:NMD protein affecting ribosome stability and mRNA decay
MNKCIICGEPCDITIDGMCEDCFRIDMLCRDLAERRRLMDKPK